MDCENNFNYSDDVELLFSVGRRFLTGNGVEKDVAKGKQMLSQAAMMGHSLAQQLLDKYKQEEPQAEGGLEVGLTHTSRLIVGDADTAISLGSGDMPVLATPRMMALMENAAMLAVASELEEGSTTVGGHIESSHLKPSAVGREVTATATLIKVEGKKLFFNVVAKMDETVIGEGTHLRFIVNKEKFLSRL